MWLAGLLAVIVVGGGIYWFQTNNKDAISTETGQVQTTSTDTSPLATAMPDCTLSAQPKPAEWPIDQDVSVELTWSSQNGAEAYAWHVVPMGGDIAIVTIKKGKRVPLKGTEAVVLQKRSDGFINFALAVVNSEGAAVCRFDDEKQFRTREYLDNPPKMG